MPNDSAQFSLDAIRTSYGYTVGTIDTAATTARETSRVLSEESPSSAAIDPVTKECHDLWFALIQKAVEHCPFEALCTLLRPRGMHDAEWDVLDESEATFEDFNWMLKAAQTRKEKPPLGGSLSITIVSWSK